MVPGIAEVRFIYGRTPSNTAREDAHINLVRDEEIELVWLEGGYNTVPDAVVERSIKDIMVLCYC